MELENQQPVHRRSGSPEVVTQDMPNTKIDFNVVRAMALALPHVEAGMIHGAPSFKVGGKLLCCPALHSSAEPGTLAIRIDPAERARLIESSPSIYYVTNHYLNYPTVLVRLARIDRESLENLLGTAWKFVTARETPQGQAPKRGRKKRA